MYTITLTEEQIEDRQELFFTLLDDFIEEHYEVNENHEMTEEEAYLTSIIMEYFEENYRYPRIEEASYEAITGYDINTPLYEEITEVLLDESIGSVVAGARYGVKNWLAKRKAAKATAGKESAKAAYEKHLSGKTTKADIMRKQNASKSYGSGIGGTIKKAYDQSRTDALQKRAEKAKGVMKAAETKRKSAVTSQQNVQGRSGALAKRIDTGVENIKRKIKDKVSAGASKVAGFIGKVAGATQKV